jgi:hypothetical protein
MNGTKDFYNTVLLYILEIVEWNTCISVLSFKFPSLKLLSSFLVPNCTQTASMYNALNMQCINVNTVIKE